jgi:glucose/arabinose dehydrogenase
MKAEMKPLSLLLAALLLVGCSKDDTPQAAQGNVTTVLVASGLELPTFVTAAPGDTSRIFILEQYTGKIKILKGGQLPAAPFIDLGARVSESGSERGLLGMAFHPNYASNRFFYINFTDKNGNTVVARYQATSADAADPSSEHLILGVDQPYANHNGGMLAFGPDGYLYVGLGDGGASFDPENRAQNGQELLGKMLRLDVNGGDPYSIPPDNPFVNNPAMRPEIWALGLRNPWRYCFDPENGSLYIADVGQNAWEEINVQPAGVGGQNYGWRMFEGTHSTGRDGASTVVTTLTAPIHEYSHAGGNCSLTGGYVYRGSALPELRGLYFFADYCTARIWSLRFDGGTVSDLLDRTEQLAPGGGLSIGSISSFGLDASGELYICDHQGGEVFKVVRK